MNVKAEIVGEEKDGMVTYYTISVIEGTRSWTVRRRYKDFLALNEDLIGTGLQRKELPSKGLVGFRHQMNIGSFNDLRRAELDAYLKDLAQQIKALKDYAVIEQFLIYADEATVVTVARENSPEGRSRPSGRTRGSQEVSERRPFSPEEANPTRSSVNTTRNPLSTTRLESEDGRRGYEPNIIPPTPAPVKAAPLPATEQLGVVVETGLLEGPEWVAFRANNKELAATIESCSKMLSNGPRFENNCEDAFKDLRRLIRNLRSDVSALDSIPPKAMVWNFILLVAEKRAFYKGQVAEVARILLTSELCREALKEKPELENAKVRMMGDA